MENMKKTTQELLLLLKNTPKIETYLENHQESLISISLPDALTKLLQQKAISKSACIQKSGLDRTYGYQIFSGMKTPSRDKLLSLCFAMELGGDETQNLLNQTGYTCLYPRHKRDSVLLFALHKNLSVTEVNELLFEMGLALLQ